MLILPEHRLVYLDHMKNATHTLYHVLGQCGAINEGVHHGYRDLPRYCLDWGVIAAVRDPYTRAVSVWRHLRARGTSELRLQMPGPHTWERSMEWIAAFTRGRAHWFGSSEAWYRRFNVVHVLHVETLEADFRQLPFAHLHPQPLPRLHVTGPDDSGPATMSERAVAAIHRWAGADFEEYGYERRAAA